MATIKRKTRLNTERPDEDGEPPVTAAERRAAAKSIQMLLRPGVHLVPCTVDDDGRLVLSSLASRKIGRTRLAVLPSWRGKKKATRRAA